MGEMRYKQRLATMPIRLADATTQRFLAGMSFIATGSAGTPFLRGNFAAEARIGGQRSVMLMRVTDQAQTLVATASFGAFSVYFRTEIMPYNP